MSEFYSANPRKRKKRHRSPSHFQPFSTMPPCKRQNQTQGHTKSWFALLPDEVVVCIFGGLPVWMYGICRLVCWRWRSCMQEYWNQEVHRPGMVLEAAVAANNLSLFTWFVRCPKHHAYILSLADRRLLHKCIGHARVEMARVLLTTTTTTDTPAIPTEVKPLSVPNNTTIETAARSGNLETLLLVLSAWRGTEKIGASLAMLYAAYTGGSVACIKLLKQRIDKSHLTCDYGTIIERAARGERIEGLFDPHKAMEAAARGGHRFLIDLVGQQYEAIPSVQTGVAAALGGHFKLFRWLWNRGWVRCSGTLHLAPIIAGGNCALAQWYIFKKEKEGYNICTCLKYDKLHELYVELLARRNLAMMDLLYMNDLTQGFATHRSFAYAIQGDDHDVVMLQWLFDHHSSSRGGLLSMTIWAVETGWMRAVSVGSVDAVRWFASHEEFRTSLEDNPEWVEHMGCSEGILAARRKKHFAVLNYLRDADWFPADPFDSRFSPV